MQQLKLTLTPDLPRREGWYYYYNLKEEIATIVYANPESDGRLYISNDEYGFYVSPKIQLEFSFMDISDDTHDHDLWCHIPFPYLNGKQVNYKY